MDANKLELLHFGNDVDNLSKLLLSNLTLTIPIDLNFY